jgi:hypothetical protein
MARQKRQHKKARPRHHKKGQALVEVFTPSLGQTFGQICGQNSHENCRQIRPQDFIGQRQKAAQQIGLIVLALAADLPWPKKPPAAPLSASPK